MTTTKLKVRATSCPSLSLYNTSLQQQYINAIDFSATSRWRYV